MTERKLCCGFCFGDRFLTRHIAAVSVEMGNCFYCGSQDVSIVPPSDLSDAFGLLTNIYQFDSGGRPLVEWLKKDWALFGHENLGNDRATELLAEMLSDRDVAHKRFIPSPRYQSAHLNNWEKLREELMYQNRYFPNAQLDADRLKELLSQLIADNVPVRWYRARLQAAEEPFEISEMGAPPRRSTSHGRANPAGIPYLYLGSTPDTAVSEVRPHTGETASVADFTLDSGLKIVDLRNPRLLVSPFVLADEDDIGLLRSDISFLERLEAELTTPIIPHSALIDYVPSQYLCEFIKNCGYDGVLYSSSVSDGMNLALFSRKRVQPGTVFQYAVEKVHVSVRKKDVSAEKADSMI